MSYKRGANVIDINKIKQLAESGKGSKAISTALQIDESVVKSFLKPAPKASTKE